MKPRKKDDNFDQNVIDGFGYEWSKFEYPEADEVAALDAEFQAYCSPINLDEFNPGYSICGDFGAGSGRWTSRLIPYFKKVYAVEPSIKAFETLSRKFHTDSGVTILNETIGENSIPCESLDIAISLGVLHHMPNTKLGIEDISTKLKPGGVFLCYLYYNLEDKPLFYRVLSHMVLPMRFIISRLPFKVRGLIAKLIAVTVYWPLARVAKMFGHFGFNISNFPLHHYAYQPFVMLANDALDRFGTRLEKRYSKNNIIDLFKSTDFDLKTLNFSSVEPFWTFSIHKNESKQEGA
jgi:SAM-dependent methyltransferase